MSKSSLAFPPVAAALLLLLPNAWAAGAVHDLVIRNALIDDGLGGKPYAGDITVDGDRISYVGPPRELKGRTQMQACTSNVGLRPVSLAKLERSTGIKPPASGYSPSTFERI